MPLRLAALASCLPLGVGLVLVAAQPAWAAGSREVKPDFGGRGVLDLSDNQAPMPGKDAKTLTPRHDPALAPGGNCGDEPIGQLPWIGEDDLEDARMRERGRIGGTEGMVSRQGKRLVVTPARGGPPITFTDWD